MNKIITGDALAEIKNLPVESVDCVITSPPYWSLRDYNHQGQIGLEKTPEEYIDNLVRIFSEVRRVLKPQGTLWLNLGDTYSAQRWSENPGKELNSKGKNKEWSRLAAKRESQLPDKNLVGIPWRVAFALQADGWILRQDIIWHKPNPMPESVTDRCTKAHEYIFLLSKNQKYYFDQESIRDPVSQSSLVRLSQNLDRQIGSDRVPGKANGNMKAVGSELRNKRSVWQITTRPFKDAHFAVFPEKLVVPMIYAGCPKGGVVLDPFFGAGTTGVVAKKLGRRYIGIEINSEYVAIAEKRLRQEILL